MTLGKNVLLPGGFINDVEVDSHDVSVERTNDEIKNSPEFDESRYRETGYRDEVGAYYSRQYPGGDIP